MGNTKAIGIDLGATRIKGVVLELETGRMLATEMLATEKEGSWKKSVSELVTRLRGEESSVGVGIAAPGLVAEDARSIASMPGRMQGLEGFDWQEFLGLPVSVINDAHAALTAEVNYGVAANLENVVMLTLGTGVGGGVWLNGKLYLGKQGRAGHLGHISLDAGSLHSGITGIPGSLEDAIGNATVHHRTYGKYADTQALVEAFRSGEPLATWAWLSSLRQLAVGIASLINVFSPEIVVLGGGITSAGNALFGPLKTFMDIFEWRPTAREVPIRKAHFNEWSGAVGAAAQFKYQ